jgi:hypothetical protein
LQKSGKRRGCNNKEGLGNNVTVSDNVIGLRDVKLNMADKSAVVPAKIPY